jgi:hypothetical protein
MVAEAFLSPESWAEQEFGQVELGDHRRTRRAVKVAAQMARYPSASIPERSGNWAATKASYRLFKEEEVTFEGLSAQHRASTRCVDGEGERVLLIQDTSCRKCLKTGCSAENRQPRAAERLGARLGLLVVVAVRLLQLKQHAGTEPDRPAITCAPQGRGRVRAAYLNRTVEGWTIREFRREVARLGGFLARKSDGEPGWQTIWRGWRKLDLPTIGAKLAASEGKNVGKDKP